MHHPAKTITSVLLALFILVACTPPDPGVEGWCEKLKDKPKSEWKAEEIKKYTNECIGLSED
jgi:hypothetical protein